MKKHFLTVIALLCALSLVLCGCGGKTAEETQAQTQAPAPAETAPFGLSETKLSTSTWSSPNGATVHLSAVPNAYKEGQSAAFLVRLDGEEVANIPCQWNGTAFTADAELNAADGFSYSVLFTDELGAALEIPVDASEALVNMAASLQSYCNLLVEETTFENNVLTITKGNVKVQTPQITNEGETITVTEAKLILTKEGQEAATADLTLAGASELALTDSTLKVPALENDQQVVLTLRVTLSNGYVLLDEGCTFFYNEGELLTAVG